MIPKIIWQTYETEYNDLSKEIKNYIESWTKNYPNFDYRYMSAKERNKFVKDNFGSEWYKIFINLPYNVMRSDVWKQMILYVHGGVYFDLDMSPNYKIDSWLLDDYSMVLFADESEKDQFLFYYHIMASEPKHIITKTSLDYMFDRFNSLEYQEADKSMNYFVAQYSAEIPLKYGVKKVLDVNNMLLESSNHVEYNNLPNSKKYKFFCYGGDYDVIYGKAFINMDGSNNWKIGYNSWWNDVKKYKMGEQ